MQDARETVRGAKLYFCSQTEIQERYKVTMSQIYLEMNHIKKTFGELEVLRIFPFPSIREKSYR